MNLNCINTTFVVDFRFFFYILCCLVVMKKVSLKIEFFIHMIQVKPTNLLMVNLIYTLSPWLIACCYLFAVFFSSLHNNRKL